jgi:cytochrome oxidase Cu insertion factor (SCO1/SenC/PrrC family)
MRRRALFPLLGLAALLALAVALAAILGGSSSHGPAATEASSGASSTSGFDGAALPAGVSAPAFALTDQYGHVVSPSAFRGQVTILTFLYSTCGATCVVIAQQIRGALDDLPHPVPVLVVSADPAADTPARVSSFLEQVSLAGRVHYLSGPLSRLRSIWRAYRIAPASGGRAAFARSASVLLLDGRGRERVLYQLEQLTPESLAHDIRRLQAG